MKNLILALCFLYTGAVSFGNERKLYDDLTDALVYKRGSEELIYPKMDSIKKDTAYYRALKNTIFVELGGSGLLYSFNYERQMPISPYLIVSARAGVSMERPGSFYFPVLLNVIAGCNGHNAETGIGTTMDLTHYKLSNTWDLQMIVAFTNGYRYQKPNGRWLLRVNVTPLFSINKSEKSPSSDVDTITDGHDVTQILWLGISFGYRF